MLWMLRLCLLLPPADAFWLPITIKPEKEIPDVAVCCQESGLQSCTQAQINPEDLGGGQIVIPNGPDGQIFTFNNAIPPFNINTKSFNYISELEESLVIVYNPSNGNMHAHCKLASGNSIKLEYCGIEGHVWKLLGSPIIQDEGELDHGLLEPDGPNVVADFNGLVEKGKASDDPASYSVKFYYTKAFKAATPDIEGFTDLCIAETNQGYINSGIKVTVLRCCIEEATIDEIQNAYDFYYAFRDMKGSTTKLRGTADQTTLLSMSFGAGGIGAVNSISRGGTVTIAQKNYAVGYFTFGHEIGHNFGCLHDPANSNNIAYPDGHGHLIERIDIDSVGYRTVLAYSAEGHSQRVNHYSNPDVMFSTTQTSTGVEGLSNNARVIMINRFAMEAVGDESECTATCGQESPPTTMLTLLELMGELFELLYEIFVTIIIIIS